jgi:hypothetical protein
MENANRDSTHQAERFFYSARQWWRQDEWGNQRSIDEFGHVVFTHVPRHAKADEGHAPTVSVNC